MLWDIKLVDVIKLIKKIMLEIKLIRKCVYQHKNSIANLT